MYVPLLGLCLGVALVAAFPHRSLLDWLGILIFVGSALGLALMFVRSILRSIRSREWHGDQLLVGFIVVLLAAFFVQRLDSPGDNTEIERTLGTVATSTDPAYCDELTTQRYLRQITGETALFADDVCEAEAGRGSADSVEVSEIDVDGDRATAVVTNGGGSFDGSAIVTGLVEVDGEWRVDRLISFQHFDRAGFRRHYRVNLEEFGLSREKTGCVLRREGRLSNAEMEAALIGSNRATLVRLAIACDRDSVKRNVESAVAGLSLDRPGVAECVERRLETTTDAELIRLQLHLAAYNRLLFSCAGEAVLAYHRRELDAGGLETDATDCVVELLRNLETEEAIRLTHDETEYRATIERCRSNP